MNDPDAKKPLTDDELIDIDSPEALEDPSDDEQIAELAAERDEFKDRFMRTNSRARGRAG